MAQTVTIVLSNDDIIDYKLSREHWEPVEYLRTRGFTAGATTSSNAPVFSKWPGTAPGFGNEDSTEDKLIVDSVQDNYNRNGRRGARKNRIYVNSSGIWRKAPTLELTLFGAYDVIDPANAEWIEFDVGAVANLRGTAVSDFRWIAHRVSVSYEGGTARTTLTLDAETHGEPGVDDTPPPENTNGLPDYNPPGFDFPIIVTPTITPEQAAQLPAGQQRIAYIGTNGLALTSTFGSGDATSWTLYSWASLGVSGTPVQWVPHAGTNPARGRLITTTGWYDLTLATPSATLKHTFAASTAYRSADASFGADTTNHCVVRSYHEGVGIRTAWTEDNATFNEELSNANRLSNTNIAVYPGCFVSSRVAGKVLSSAYTNIGNSFTPTALSEGKESTDYGDTFGALSSPAFVTSAALAQHIHVPWGTGNEDTVFYGVITDSIGTNTSHRLYRNGDDISPVISGVKYGPRGSRDGMMTYVGNANRMLAALQRAPSPDYWVLFMTDNALAASPSWTALELGTLYRRCAISGDHGGTFYFTGDNGAVALSVDSGQTIVSQMGNLGSLNPGNAAGIVAGF